MCFCVPVRVVRSNYEEDTDRLRKDFIRDLKSLEKGEVPASAVHQPTSAVDTQRLLRAHPHLERAFSQLFLEAVRANSARSTRHRSAKESTAANVAAAAAAAGKEGRVSAAKAAQQRQPHTPTTEDAHDAK